MTADTSRRIANYEIITRLAVGGMGEIFLARQLGIAGFERRVVIKTLFTEASTQRYSVERFLDEARLAATLSHPNVISIIEVGQAEGLYFIAMEFIAGMNLVELSELIEAQHRSTPPRVIAAIVRQAAIGLDYAHRATDDTGVPLNLVHRDVSPQNIMVRQDGLVKVVDFGIAHAANQISRTETGSLHGKLSYLSPEQLEGRTLDERTDQFSLGIVMWELFTQRKLFSANNLYEAARQIVQVPIVPLVVAAPDCPSQVDEIAMRMLQRSPEARFDSCADVANALQAYLDASGGNADNEVTSFLDEVAGPKLNERSERIRQAATRPSEQPARRARASCPSCSREQPVGARFCTSCGASMTTQETSEIALDGARAQATAPEVTEKQTREAPGPSITFEDGVQMVDLATGEAHPASLELTGGNTDRTHPYLKSPYRGRDAVLHTALSALRAADRGATQLRLLVGDVGMGKTHLLAQIEIMARKRGFVVARAQGARRGAPLALDVFRQWVISICSALASAPRGAGELQQVSVTDALTWLTEIELPMALARRVAQLFDGSKFEVVSDAEEHSERLAASVMQFLLTTSRAAPLCLLLDDAHSADAHSLELLGQVKTRLPAIPLALFATCLPEATEQLPFGEDHLELAGLGDDALLLAAGDELSTGTLPPQLATALIASSWGNPMVAKRQIQAMLESRALFHDGDGLSFEILDEAHLFERPIECTTALLEQLDATALHALRVAALLGEIFTPELLEAACAKLGVGVGEALDRAVGLGLVDMLGRFDELRQFRQSSTRQHLLRGIKETELEQLRSAVGAAYDRSASVPRGEATEIAAWYLLATTPVEGSAQYIASVARRLLRQGMHRQAGDWFMRALGIRLGQLACQPQIVPNAVAELFDLADSSANCLLKSDPVKIATTIQSLLERLPPRLAPQERARATRQRARALLELNQEQVALAAFDEGLRLLPPLADPVVRAALQADRALALEAGGDVRGALVQLTDALQAFGSTSGHSSEGLAERLDLMARLYRKLSALYAQVQHPDLAEQSGQRAFDLAQRAGQPLGEIRALQLMAELARARDDLERTRSLLSEARTIAEQLQDVWVMAQVYLAHGLALCESDRTLAAELLTMAVQHAKLSDQFSIEEQAQAALETLT